ncbi:hypothetical protein E5C31_03690 [Providencia rettgeri]|nr:hypothetical protein [Providencia rettgeri]
MLNRDLIQQARTALESAIKKHEEVSKKAIGKCTELYDLRKGGAHSLVKEVEAYVNTIKATPAGFKSAFEEYKVSYSAFDKVIYSFDQKTKDTTVKSAAGAGAGVTVGAATAFLGPSAAMAIATTFGTASTGTAISALGGAAATNAALAWLGGGALVAGGGGMSAGTALLGLAGPVGWALAGTAVAGGAIFMRHANAKAAEEASSKRMAVEAEVRSLQASHIAVTHIFDQTKATKIGLSKILVELRDTLKVTSRHNQPKEVLEMFGAMINHVRTLGELLSKTVELKAN